MKGQLQALFARVGRTAQVALVAGLIGAFVVVLLAHLAPAKNAHPAAAAVLASATATASPAPTATASVPLSGPTPTLVPGHSGPVIPGGPVPFQVTAIRADATTWASPQPDQECLGPASSTAPDSYQTASIFADFYYHPHTDGGNIVYRWHVSDGQVTNPITIVAKYPTYNMQLNMLSEPTDLHIPATEADGRAFTAQLELLEPTHLLAAPVTFYVARCVLEVRFVQTFTDPDRVTTYQCGGADQQSWTYTGHITTTLSPGGTLAYHWLWTDGTTSATQTIAVPAGEDVITSPTQTLTLSSATPSGTYGLQLVVTAPRLMAGGQVTYATVTKSCG